MREGSDLAAPELDQPVLELQAGQEATAARQTQPAGTSGAVTPIASGGTGASTSAGALANLGAAPLSATYVTLTTSGGLSAERVLTGTALQILITDNGAGNTVVLSFIPSTGWTSNPTGTLTRTTFDSGTVTLPELAERVAALIVDLRAKGSLGT